MKETIRFIILILAFMTLVPAQAQQNGQYFVAFSDKAGTPYNLSQPSAFLSQRSIERRQAQGIALDMSDLPVTPAYVASLSTIPGVIPIHPLKWLNGAVVAITDSSMIPSIQALPHVSAVKFLSPELPQFSLASSPRIIGDVTPSWPVMPGLVKPQSLLMNLDVLYEGEFFGEGMLIAVLDAGFSHADTMKGFASLRNNQQIIATRDFVDPGPNPFRGSTHGTSVLSIMGGYVEGQYMGTAPMASYCLLRTEKASSEYLLEEYLWMAGAEFADSIGADLINSSLGYTDFDDSSQNHSYATLDGNTAIASIAADLAASKGILVITSAGNQGTSPWFRIGAPADADSVLAIGAVNSEGQYATFSSKGPRVDGRVKPDVAAVGWQTEFLDLNSKVSKGNGTSFAAPMLTGAAACLWQSFPEASAAEVRDAIIRSADQYLKPDSLTGYGIPDFAVASQLLRGKTIPTLGNENLMVYPNPFDSRIVLMFNAEGDGSCQVMLIDRIGRVVYKSEDFEYQTGYNSYQIKGLDHLASGLYFVVIRGDGIGQANRILK